jgi:hypothetical protein
LEEWLNHSKKKSCELCGAFYKFDPLYSENIPESIPTTLVASTIFKRFFTIAIPVLVHLCIVVVLWLLVLPVGTSWFYRLLITRPVTQDNGLYDLILSRLSLQSLDEDVVVGLLVAGLIALSFLVLMSFTDFLRFNFDPRAFEDEADVAEDDAANVEEQVAEIDRRVAQVEAEALRRRQAGANNAVRHDVDNHEHEPVPVPEQQRIERQWGLERNNEEPVIDNGNPHHPPQIPAIPPANDIRVDQDARPMPPPENLERHFPVGFLAEGDIFEEPDPGEFHFAIDELVGFKGSFLAPFRKICWLLGFVGAYLGVFAYLPAMLGRFILSVSAQVSDFTGLKTQLLAWLHLHMPRLLDFGQTLKRLAVELSSSNAVVKPYHLAHISYGYLAVVILVTLSCMLISLLANILHISFVSYFAEALQFIRAIFKVGSLLFVRIFALPICLGVITLLNLNVLFAYSWEVWVALAKDNVIGVIALSWVVGICFMLVVTLCILQLREVLHPRFLAKIIKPQEAHQDLLNSLLYESATTHTRRIIVSFVVYFVILLIFVSLPVHFMRIGCLLSYRTENECAGLFRPQLWFGVPTLQIPAEMLCLHVLILSVTEGNKDLIGIVQHKWLVFICGKLKLTRYLLPMAVRVGHVSGSERMPESPALEDTEEVERANLPPAEPVGPAAQAEARESESNGQPPDGDQVAAEILEIESNGDEEGRWLEKNEETDPATCRFEAPLQRPPKGWETRSSMQSTRWAWGREQKSNLEENLAHRFRPNWLHIRIFLLFSISWLATIFSIAFVTVLPLATGRLCLQILRWPATLLHDPLSFILGASLLWCLYTVFTSISTLKKQNPRIVRACTHLPRELYTTILFRTALWGAVVPFVIGNTSRLLLDAVYLNFPTTRLADFYIPVVSSLLKARFSAQTGRVTCVSERFVPFALSANQKPSFFGDSSLCGDLLKLVVEDWLFGVLSVLIFFTIALTGVWGKVDIHVLQDKRLRGPPLQEPQDQAMEQLDGENEADLLPVDGQDQDAPLEIRIRLREQAQLVRVHRVRPEPIVLGDPDLAVRRRAREQRRAGREPHRGAAPEHVAGARAGAALGEAIEKFHVVEIPGLLTIQIGMTEFLAMFQALIIISVGLEDNWLREEELRKVRPYWTQFVKNFYKLEKVVVIDRLIYWALYILAPISIALLSAHFFDLASLSEMSLEDKDVTTALQSEYGDGILSFESYRRVVGQAALVVAVLSMRFVIGSSVERWAQSLYTSIRDEHFLVGKRLQSSSQGLEKMRTIFGYSDPDANVEDPAIQVAFAEKQKTS